MSCEAFQARFLAGEVAVGREGHLAACAACRSAIGGLEALRDRLADPLLWEEPEADLGMRVVAAVAGEAEAARVRRRTRGTPVWVAAVAAVAVVAAGAVGLTRYRAPDWEVALVPTGAAPVAVAEVAGWNTDRGTRMELEVRGLETLGPDAYYEVWLTSSDGRHVSAGTFRGSGEVTLWVGVRRADYPRIWVTLEPADGDPAPSGRTVLDTRL